MCTNKDKPSENKNRLGIARSHTPSPAYKKRLRQAGHGQPCNKKGKASEML